MSQEFFGESRDRDSFWRLVSDVANNLISVATNYTRQEDRPCLSAHFDGKVVPDGQEGYLIAVRLDAGAPKYLEALAKDLHEGIQAYYRALETPTPERLAELAEELAKEVGDEPR